MTDPRTRRGVIAGTGLAIAGLAGCVGGNGSDGTADDDRSDDGGSDSETSVEESGSDGDESGGDGDQDLDLAEANVTAVAIEPDGDGAYAFDVTLVHDDGEEGYANWWQVETPDGDRLGRRELRHAHGNEPFTRSETISIPADVECVVVRGHDRTHGYGGRAMLVTLSSGATNVRRQGSEPSDFTDADCP